MRLYFIRHGHPDYEKDSLTERGRDQALALASSLSRRGLDRLFTSTCGRAKETAEYAAKRCHLPVTDLPFMEEIHWDAHPWTRVHEEAKNGDDLHLTDSLFLARDKQVAETHDRIVVGLDAWLKTLGFEREGDRYRCIELNHERIGVFAHAGANTIVLSHLLGIPLQKAFLQFGHLDFTSVTSIGFSAEPGELLTPTLWLYNDTHHLH